MALNKKEITLLTIARLEDNKYTILDLINEFDLETDEIRKIVEISGIKLKSMKSKVDEFVSRMDDWEYTFSELVGMFRDRDQITKSLSLFNKKVALNKNDSSSFKESRKWKDEFFNIELPEFDKEKEILSTWFIRWYRTYREDGLREVSRFRYSNDYRRIKNSPLGSMKIKDIERRHIQSYIQKFGVNYAKGTVLDHITFLKACFRDAFIDGHIRSNPAENIKPVYREQNLSVKEYKELRERKKWLDLEEYTVFKDFLKSIIVSSSDIRKVYYATITMVALKTGARYSEILGLTTQDILKKDAIYLNVDKTFDYKKIENGDFFIPTKNFASIREILIDDETLEMIEIYLEKMKEQGIYRLRDTLFVTNQFSTGNAIANNFMKYACKKCKIEPITIHKLRHTAASYLIANKIDMMVVAKRLGHTDTTMVIKTYGHLLREVEEEENSKILELI